MCPCIVPVLIPASMNKSIYLSNHMQKPDYDKLNSLHALCMCACNWILFYFFIYFKFNEIIFQSKIDIVF